MMSDCETGISLYDYCTSIVWFDNKSYLIGDTLVQYVSHRTQKQIDVSTANAVLRWRELPAESYMNNCNEAQIDFLPDHQVAELNIYIKTFTTSGLTEREEKCQAVQLAFLPTEKRLEGLNALQQARAGKLLRSGDPLPVVRSEEFLKAITCFDQMDGLHMWGIQFRQVMAQLGQVPVKLLNERKVHHDVPMLENVEIGDPAHFFPHRKCIAGIHGTTSIDFFHWLNYNHQRMKYYAEVEVFDDSQVVVSDGWKFKTDRLILRRIRLISELPQWSDPDFVFRACGSGINKCAAAAATSPLTPLMYKLRGIRVHPEEYIANIPDFKQEPFVMQKIAISHMPTLITHLDDPCLELVMDAIRVRPDLVSQLHCENSIVFQTACGLRSELIVDIPSRFITEDMLKLYLATNQFNFLNDEVPENVVEAVLASPASFYQWMMKQAPKTLFRLVQFMPNRDDLLHEFVEVVAQCPRLMKYVTNQPADFQWSVLRATKEGYLMQYVEHPTDEMCEFAATSLPDSLAYLPQPWSTQAIVKAAIERDADILDEIKVWSNELIVELLKKSQGESRITKKIVRRVNFCDEKFVEELVRAVPIFIDQFTRSYAERYQLAAVESAIASNSLQDLVFKLGKTWYWKKETWHHLIKAIPTLMNSLPIVKNQSTSRAQFDPDFDDLICHQVSLNPKLFEDYHQFFSGPVIARCLAQDAKNIEYIADSTQEQQFIAIAPNPLNIRYIKYPFDGVIAWAVQANEESFALVKNFGKNFGNKNLQSDLVSMLKKRKDESGHNDEDNNAKVARSQ